LVDHGEEFDALYSAEFVGIARAVSLIVGDARTGEELTQDAFATAWSRWSRVRAAQHPGAWVRTVAVRLAFKSLKRTRRRHALQQLQVDRAPASVDGMHVDIHRALGALPHNQRAAVVLHALADLSASDIGAALGCSAATARVHLHRGRQQLEVLLGTEDRDVTR
jgi:RNA polymerase sigma factor (sigma-70 family)